MLLLDNTAIREIHLPSPELMIHKYSDGLGTVVYENSDQL